MMSNFELERLRTLDRLLSVGHETVDDLLSQAITVANMIDPQPTDKVVMGPLERLISENINLNNKIERMNMELSSIRSGNINKYGHAHTNDIQWTGSSTYAGQSTWPSNPGMYSSASSISSGFTALTIEDIKKMTVEAQIKAGQQTQETTVTDQIRQQLRNLTTDMKNK